MAWSEGLASARSGLAQTLGILTQLASSIAAKKASQAQVAQGWVGTILGAAGKGADIYGDIQGRKLAQEQFKTSTDLAREQMAQSQGQFETEQEAKLAGRGFPTRLATAQQMAGERSEASRRRFETELAEKEHGWQMEEIGAREKEKGKAGVFTPSDYAAAKVTQYMQSPAAYEAGIVDVSGALIPEKVDKNVVQSIIDSTFTDAYNTAEAAGYDLTKNEWTRAIREYFGMDIKEKKALEEVAKRAEEQKAAEERKRKQAEEQQRQSQLKVQFAGGRPMPSRNWSPPPRIDQPIINAGPPSILETLRKLKRK